MMSLSSADNEAKKMKRDLEGWREVLLPAYSLLTWQTSGAPGIIFGVTTLIFLVIYYMQLSVLTVCSGILFMAAMLDYLVPIASAQLINSKGWTAAKEKELEKISKILCSQKHYALYTIKKFGSLRTDRPKTFYMVSIPSLLFLMWVSLIVDNLLLTYFIVLGVLMMPGLKEKGVLGPLLQSIVKLYLSLTAKEAKIE